MSEASHASLTEAVKLMRNAEYWSLRKQEPHEGKNDSTDKGIAISRVALPALENAVAALEADDFDAVIDHLTLAVNTDGSAPPRHSNGKKTRRRQ